MADKLDFRGVADARPASSPEPTKGQGGHVAPTGLDFKGELDSRPHANPTDVQRVNVGDGAVTKKTGGLTGI